MFETLSISGKTLPFTTTEQLRPMLTWWSNWSLAVHNHHDRSPTKYKLLLTQLRSHTLRVKVDISMATPQSGWVKISETTAFKTSLWPFRKMQPIFDLGGMSFFWKICCFWNLNQHQNPTSTCVVRVVVAVCTDQLLCRNEVLTCFVDAISGSWLIDQKSNKTTWDVEHLPMNTGIKYTITILGMNWCRIFSNHMFISRRKKHDHIPAYLKVV